MNIYNIEYNSSIDNEALFVKAKEGCEHSKELLFQNTIPLVISLAKKWCRKTTYNDKEEMVSIGINGLMKAYKFFDITKGNKFSTLVAKAVWQNFIVDAKKAKRSVRTKYDSVSFDVENYDDDLLSRHETITDIEVICPFNEVDDQVLNETLYIYLMSKKSLQENERHIALEHFIYGKSLSDIAREKDVSRQNIHQIFKRCVGKIKEDKNCPVVKV